jgi:hypothetical protein
MPHFQISKRFKRLFLLAFFLIMSLFFLFQILDLKGTPKSVQGGLLDSFLTITSTKTDLQSTSFLSSLDMDPPATGHAGGSLVSPGASRMILPLGGSISEGIFGSSSGGPPTAGIGGAGENNRTENPRREVFSDFRRFVSFGLRKDTTAPS